MEKRSPSEDSPLNGVQTSKYQQVVSTETNNCSSTPHTSDACLNNRRRSFIVCGFVTCLVLAIILGTSPAHRPFRLFNNDGGDVVGVTIAFVGNSMFYFNDFPRFFQTLAGHDLVLHQDSCLHGGGSIPSLLMEGNAMYPRFQTKPAILDGPSRQMGETIYDYGACTPKQLVLGTDDRLDDPGYAQPTEQDEMLKNPCRHPNATYFDWAKQYFSQQNVQWDYVIINDNTRDPARASTRARSMAFLEQFWAPMLRESGATPVFLWTHAYKPIETANKTHNMTGLEDMGNFTSLTYAGLKAYVRLLSPLLPANQQPRIAPSGLAFLAVYEQDVDVWHTLFNIADHLHASPSGTFLQGLCVYHTLFGKLPPKDQVVQTHMEQFWRTARMMQHADEPPNPIPTASQAAFLYDIAQRVLVEGYVPALFVNYTHGEAAEGQE